MSSEIETCIRDNIPWTKLPNNIKQLLGNSQKEYEKQIVEFSVGNQLRHKGNIIRHVKKDEEKYYQLLVNYSREHLMLYPYHLADIIVCGLRLTPFQYYIDIMQDLMNQERSYDSLPNFTAADVVRLVGIGRNEYIDLMNRSRSSKKLMRRQPQREILPLKPLDIRIEPWWLVNPGCLLEEDIKNISVAERKLIDTLLEERRKGAGGSAAGLHDLTVLRRLHERGLVYFDVPISDNDCMIVPPLDGFVMNRVQGDYFENLLYKIFVSIDEHTTVSQLASSVLEIDLQLVKNALSVFCRLSIAHKKDSSIPQLQLNSTWTKHLPPPCKLASLRSSSLAGSDDDFIDMLDSELEQSLTADTPADGPAAGDGMNGDASELDASAISSGGDSSAAKRLGLLFDSTLTALLMMGNLSATLKSHAVTLFEVGKLTNEALDGFIEELNKITPCDATSESTDAGDYWLHATILRRTLGQLRTGDVQLDLLRCESLLGLERAARCRVLRKNYSLLISIAPLSNEITPVNSSFPPNLGPPIAEANSPWFKLFIYQLTGSGPTSVLLSKGSRLRRIPRALQNRDCLLMNQWAHDPGVVHCGSCLPQINDQLTNASIFLQAYAENTDVVHIPFSVIRAAAVQTGSEVPLGEDAVAETETCGPLCSHPAAVRLSDELHLQDSCGYITLLRYGKTSASPSAAQSHHTRVGSRDPRKTAATEHIDAAMSSHNYAEWLLYDCVFGVPLFDSTLNETICKQLTAHQQFTTTDGLERLRQCNRRLSVRLLDFISGFQPEAGSLDPSNDTGVGSLGAAERSVPYPTFSLQFVNDKVAQCVL